MLADVPAPADPRGRAYDKAAYYANIRSWVERGGNLVLTDKALHALGDLGVVPAEAVQDIAVYQPYANFQDFGHPMTEGLRPNAHQLVEAATLGYGIGTDASPMTVVDTAAWEGAGGHVVGTTTTLLTGEDPAIDRNLDDGGLTSVGELSARRCRRADQDRRRRTADADGDRGPPLRAAQLRPHLLGSVPDGEQHPARRGEARRHAEEEEEGEVAQEEPQASAKKKKR